jgi:hypothetical protein
MTIRPTRDSLPGQSTPKAIRKNSCCVGFMVEVVELIASALRAVNLGSADARRRRQLEASPVVGSMTVRTRRTAVHGKPPPLACSTMVSSWSAM